MAPLVELTASYRDRDEAVLRDARAESRALTWLTVQERRAELESLAAELAGLGEDVRTRLVGDHLVADWGSLGGELPDEVTRLTEDETRLLATVQRSFVDGPELVATCSCASACSTWGPASRRSQPPHGRDTPARAGTRRRGRQPVGADPVPVGRGRAPSGSACRCRRPLEPP